MAEQRRRPSRRQPPARRRRRKKKQFRFRLPDLSGLFKQAEFRPDVQKGGFLKYLRFTQLQRLQLLRWVAYIAFCILCLVIQDVIMSHASILGTTTELCAGAIFLITVMEGTEIGSVFVLIASCIYYFSGSAPGPYVVGLMTALGILATVFRQQVWHRSIGSIVLCAGAAMIAYELGVYGIGIFLELTRWDRLFAFLFTGILTVIAMIPMYAALFRIGQIGGNVWKE